MDKKKNKLIRTSGSLSWSEREAMIKDYLSGSYTKTALWKKYTGQDQEHGQLLRRMRMLGYVSDEISIERKKKRLPSLIHSTNTALTIAPSKQDPSTLQQRIKELEKQLEGVQLKVEGYELMLEMAEKEFQLPLRKKFVTK